MGKIGRKIHNGQSGPFSNPIGFLRGRDTQNPKSGKCFSDPYKSPLEAGFWIWGRVFEESSHENWANRHFGVSGLFRENTI